LLALENYVVSFQPYISPEVDENPIKNLPPVGITLLENRLSELENYGAELCQTSSKIESKIENVMEIIALVDKPTVGHPQDTRGENQQQRQGKVSLKYMVVPALAEKPASRWTLMRREMVADLIRPWF
jgi:hypothetical protein